MEVVEGHKVTFQETREQTKVHLDPTRLYKWKVSSRWADFRWSVFSFFFRCSPRQRTGTRARWPQGWSCSGACSQKSPGSSSPPGKSENNCKSFQARRETKQNKITEILLLPLSCTHLQKERASCMIRQFKTIISINLFCVQSWRGVRSDAQLSCTETRFQKCSQNG